MAVLKARVRVLADTLLVVELATVGTTATLGVLPHLFTYEARVNTLNKKKLHYKIYIMLELYETYLGKR